MKRKHASFFLFFLCAFHSVQPLTHDTQDLVVLFLFLFVSFRFTLPSLLSSIVSERKTKEREGHNTSKQPEDNCWKRTKEQVNKRTKISGTKWTHALFLFVHLCFCSFSSLCCVPFYLKQNQKACVRFSPLTSLVFHLNKRNTEQSPRYDVDS